MDNNPSVIENSSTVETHYDKFYKKGGFGYDKKLDYHKKWIHTNCVKDGDKEKDGSGVKGCDGFWSKLFYHPI